MSETVQVNVSMEEEDRIHLDGMAREDGHDNRSSFVRWLVRKEYARRFSTPQPLVTIEQAQAVADLSK